MPHDISLFFGVAWYVVFLFSVTFHEASHALAALKLGDDTAHRGGQVTLDPTPHIMRAPIGMVVAPILSYLFSGWMLGWASAPYDPNWARANPRRAGMMALAGPASNFLLVVLCGLAIRVGMALHFFDAPDQITFVHVVATDREGLAHLAATLLSIGFSLNLILCFFNMLPFPPLDGSALPLLFLSDAASAKYNEFMSAPGLRMIGLFVAWQIFGPIFSPIHHLAIRLLYPELHYIW